MNLLEEIAHHIGCDLKLKSLDVDIIILSKIVFSVVMRKVILSHTHKTIPIWAK